MLRMISAKNPTEAFEKLYDEVMTHGVLQGNVKEVFNQAVIITNPMERVIKTPWRKFSEKYAEKEWEWYKSGNPSAVEISKYAGIWKNHMDPYGNVNSNYGHQWQRNNQLQYVINLLKREPSTRQAVVTILDMKEHLHYRYDTPCTQGIHFQIRNGKLLMTVTMRSNDVVYGFCNDQYQFSKLQEEVAKEVGVEVGEYVHFVSNLHIYERHFNMRNKFYAKQS